MNEIFGIPFFVLDISLIVTAIVAIALSVAVYILFCRQQEQKKINAKIEKTIDRILKIDAGAGGGIDGWEMALHDRKKKEVAERKPKI